MHTHTSTYSDCGSSKTSSFSRISAVIVPEVKKGSIVPQRWEHKTQQKAVNHQREEISIGLKTDNIQEDGYSREPSDSTTKARKRFVKYSCFHVVCNFYCRISSFPTTYSIYRNRDIQYLLVHINNGEQNHNKLAGPLQHDKTRHQYGNNTCKVVVVLTFKCIVITSSWFHELGMAISNEFYQLGSTIS